MQQALALWKGADVRLIHRKRSPFPKGEGYWGGCHASVRTGSQ